MAAAHDASGLAAILEPEVHAVLWRRPPDEAVSECVARSECRFGRRSRAVVRARGWALRAELSRLMPAELRRACPTGVQAWLEDAVSLCRAFRRTLDAHTLAVSFEQPADATCPRFHVDRVGIRMLVTYRGPGTEILPEAHVDRRWLGAAGHGMADEESGVIRPGAAVVSAEPFTVVLLKGEAWPNTEGFGAVHRSPRPVDGPRTVFRVDLVK